MATLPPSDSESQLESRAVRMRRRARRLAWSGVAIMAVGLGLLAVPSTATTDEVMLRVALGFIALLGGFLLAVLPIAEQILHGNAD